MDGVNTVTPALLRLVAGALALALLAGCGSSDDEEPEASGESTSASPTVAPEEVIDVPEGVDLSEPGSSLEWDTSAVVAWQPRQEEVAAAQVTVRLVERTSFDDAFEGFRITDQMAAMTPYFVRARVENPTDIDLGRMSIPLYVEDDAGTLVESTTLQGKFAPCSGGVLPKKFQQDAKAQVCLVYLVPQGREFESVAMRVPGSQELIRWTGKVRTYKPAKSGNGAS